MPPATPKAASATLRPRPSSVGRTDAGATTAAAELAGLAAAASAPPRFGSRTVSLRIGATRTPITPTTMKAVRQPYWAARRPPISVPPAVPSGMPKAKAAMARARWLGGK